MVEYIFCGCGCGIEITLRGKNGKRRKYLKGHQNKNRKFVDRTNPTYWEQRISKWYRKGVLCLCGCGDPILVSEEWISNALTKKGVGFYYPKFNEGHIPKKLCACGCETLINAFDQKGQPKKCVPEHGGLLADFTTRMVDWEQRTQEVNEKAPYCGCGCKEKIYRTLDQVKNYSKIPKYLQGHGGRKACILQMTFFEQSFVYGSLLGDCSISYRAKGPPRITFTHGKPQKDYAYHKKEVLKRFACEVREAPSGGFGTLSYLGRTSCVPALETVLNIVSPNGKKQVNKKWLSFVDEVALAYWFMDDGSVQRSKYTVSEGQAMNSSFHTEGFSYEEQELLQEHLWERFQIKVEIKPTRSYFYLYINRENTRKLLEIITPYLCDSMKYKGLVWLG